MNEKLISLLTAKFAGVRKDGLAQMAAVLSLQVENEQEATALVEKLTDEKVNNFVKDWRKGVDKEVSEATKTHEGNLKKKYDLVEKRADPADPKPADPANPNPTDIASIVANAVKAAVEPLQQKLSSLEGQKISEARLQQLESKFGKDIPESYKAQRLADAKLIVNGMDENGFTEYLNKVESDVTAFSQELATRGLASHQKPMFGSQNSDGVSSATQQYIDSKKADGAASLGGKSLTPSNNN